MMGEWVFEREKQARFRYGGDKLGQFPEAAPARPCLLFEQEFAFPDDPLAVFGQLDGFAGAAIN